MRTLSLIFYTTVLTLALAVVPGCSDARSPLGLLSPARAETEQPQDQASSIEFVSGFPDALDTAKQSGKPLLVFFSAPECIYCQQMLQETFRDKQVIHLAESFVCVQVEADEAPEICENYHIEAFPTVQFIASDGVPLHRLLGKKEPEALASQMEVALREPQVRTAYRSGSAQR